LRCVDSAKDSPTTKGLRPLTGDLTRRRQWKQWNSRVRTRNQGWTKLKQQLSAWRPVSLGENRTDGGMFDW
jgi:hypothetical protein